MRLTTSTRVPCVGALLAGWICLMPCGADAQELQDAVIIGREFTIFSDTLQEERTVLVRVPSLRGDGDARYPVLVLLDGKAWQFHQITAIVLHYETFGRIPGLIVVGIPSTDRVRDLTPPRRHSDSDQWIEGGGGADRFMAFIGDELIPYIDAHFPTTPYRVLVGGSFGGLFTLHTLATRPEIFDAYLAISPSVWWDDGAAVERIEELFQRSDSLDVDLYVTLANEAATATGSVFGDDVSGMFRGFNELIDLLETQAPAGTSWRYHALPHKIHDMTYFESTYLGLDALFSDWRYPPELVPQGMDGLEVFVASRAEKYGTKRTAPTGWTWFGHQPRFGDPIEDALRFLNGAVSGESNDPGAYAWLATMFEDHDRLEEALANYEIAARLAEGADRPADHGFKDDVVRLQRLVGRRR